MRICFLLILELYHCGARRAELVRRSPDSVGAEADHVSLRNCAVNVMTSFSAELGYAAPPLNSAPDEPVV